MMSYTYEFARPSVTVDIAIFSIRDGALSVVLIERREAPFAGHWALPGGFVQMDEDLDIAAKRELVEEAGVEASRLEQFGTFGQPDRDERGRVITVAYLALIPSDNVTLNPSTDARDAKWFKLSELPELAFDHAMILAAARRHLAGMVSNDVSQSASVAFEFLPQKFTLAEAQSVFETIRDSPLDKRNFRKWLAARWNLIDLNEKRTGGRHRPAALFSLAGRD